MNLKVLLPLIFAACLFNQVLASESVAEEKNNTASTHATPVSSNNEVPTEVHEIGMRVLEPMLKKILIILNGLVPLMTANFPESKLNENPERKLLHEALVNPQDDPKIRAATEAVFTANNNEPLTFDYLWLHTAKVINEFKEGGTYFNPRFISSFPMYPDEKSSRLLPVTCPEDMQANLIREMGHRDDIFLNPAIIKLENIQFIPQSYQVSNTLFVRIDMDPLVITTDHEVLIFYANNEIMTEWLRNNPQFESKALFSPTIHIPDALKKKELYTFSFEEKKIFQYILKALKVFTLFNYNSPLFPEQTLINAFPHAIKKFYERIRENWEIPNFHRQKLIEVYYLPILGYIKNRLATSYNNVVNVPTVTEAILDLVHMKTNVAGSIAVLDLTTFRQEDFAQRCSAALNTREPLPQNCLLLIYENMFISRFPLSISSSNTDNVHPSFRLQAHMKIKDGSWWTIYASEAFLANFPTNQSIVLDEKSPYDVRIMQTLPNGQQREIVPDRPPGPRRPDQRIVTVIPSDQSSSTRVSIIWVVIMGICLFLFVIAFITTVLYMNSRNSRRISEMMQDHQQAHNTYNTPFYMNYQQEYPLTASNLKNGPSNNHPLQ